MKRKLGGSDCDNGNDNDKKIKSMHEFIVSACPMISYNYQQQISISAHIIHSSCPTSDSRTTASTATNSASIGYSSSYRDMAHVQRITDTVIDKKRQFTFSNHKVTEYIDHSQRHQSLYHSNNNSSHHNQFSSSAASKSPPSSSWERDSNLISSRSKKETVGKINYNPATDDYNKLYENDSLCLDSIDLFPCYNKLLSINYAQHLKIFAIIVSSFYIIYSLSTSTIVYL